MKDYLNMTSPENERKKLKNHIFGNKQDYVDYHFIGDYEVKENEKLKDTLLNLQTQIENLKKGNDKLVRVIKKMNERNNELERKVKEYGIL